MLNDVLNKKLSTCNDINIHNNDVNHESICINAVVTRSQSECSPVINQSDSNVSDVCESHDSYVSHISDESFIDVD